MKAYIVFSTEYEGMTEETEVSVCRFVYTNIEAANNKCRDIADGLATSYSNMSSNPNITAVVNEVFGPTMEYVVRVSIKKPWGEPDLGRTIASVQVNEVNVLEG